MAKEYRAAALSFEKTVKIKPDISAAYSYLGFIYWELGMLEKAYEYQAKTLEIDPNHANAYYGLALIHKRRGEMDRARANWANCVRITSGEKSAGSRMAGITIKDNIF